jgi:hypothetical protein
MQEDGHKEAASWGHPEHSARKASPPPTSSMQEDGDNKTTYISKIKTTVHTKNWPVLYDSRLICVMAGVMAVAHKQAHHDDRQAAVLGGRWQCEGGPSLSCASSCTSDSVTAAVASVFLLHLRRPPSQHAGQPAAMPSRWRLLWQPPPLRSVLGQQSRCDVATRGSNRKQDLISHLA